MDGQYLALLVVDGNFVVEIVEGRLPVAPRAKTCKGWSEKMPYNKTPRDHTEFGGGPGLIDPVMRTDRNITPEESLWEIYATNPSDPEADPATADINSTNRPTVRPWPDAATRKGTTG